MIKNILLLTLLSILSSLLQSSLLSSWSLQGAYPQIFVLILLFLYLNESEDLLWSFTAWGLFFRDLTLNHWRPGLSALAVLLGVFLFSKIFNKFWGNGRISQIFFLIFFSNLLYFLDHRKISWETFFVLPILNFVFYLTLYPVFKLVQLRLTKGNRAQMSLKLR